MIRANLKSNGGALQNGEYVKVAVGVASQSGTLTNNQITLTNTYVSCIVGVSEYNTVTIASSLCKVCAFNDITDVTDLTSSAGGASNDISNYTYVMAQAEAGVTLTFA